MILKYNVLKEIKELPPLACSLEASRLSRAGESHVAQSHAGTQLATDAFFTISQQKGKIES